MARILFVLPGPVPPPNDDRKNPVFHLSRCHEGDVILPVWGQPRSRKELKTEVKRFKYHLTSSYRFPAFVRIPWDILFVILKGLWVHYIQKRKLDVVITYGTNKTGLAALALKWLTGAKLIAEIPGTPASAFLLDEHQTSRRARWKNRASWTLARFVVRRSDGLKLLYADQLQGLCASNNKRVFVFHDFVAVNTMEAKNVDEKYILLVGGPWFLKGADVLIEAFLRIAHRFPSHRLKIAGFGPNLDYFEGLCKGEDRIELITPVPHPLALQLISACSVFVLPSRTEAMGRVLLEAMAFRKPIIASRVEGIPTYIKDGQNGILFEPGNVEDLAKKMDRVLSDSHLGSTLADNGYETVHKCLSETNYCERFDEMIEAVLREG